MQYEKASQCLSEGRCTRCSLARLYTYARAQAKSVLLQLQLHGFSRVRSTVRPVANDALHIVHALSIWDEQVYDPQLSRLRLLSERRK